MPSPVQTVPQCSLKMAADKYSLQKDGSNEALQECLKCSKWQSCGVVGKEPVTGPALFSVL